MLPIAEAAPLGERVLFGGISFLVGVVLILVRHRFVRAARASEDAFFEGIRAESRLGRVLNPSAGSRWDRIRSGYDMALLFVVAIAFIAFGLFAIVAPELGIVD